MYDPKLGRFMQTDPTGYDDGPNWYAYVGNDPINDADPSGTCGLSSCPVWSGNARADEMTRFAEQGRDSAGAPMNTSRDLVEAGLSGLLFGTAPEALALRFVAPAFRLTRIASAYAPAKTMAAAIERMSFASSALAKLRAGEGTIIAGQGASKGAAFRDAASKAAKYGGEAIDYVKISITGVTKSGERISVHAVKNLETGKIYEEKLLIGR
jgi:uncharacterized protein RhaS with RHS repeats